MCRSFIVLALVAVLAGAQPVSAASPGDLDPLFSGDGIATTFADGSIATAVQVDGRGRIVVGGYTLSGGVDVAIARFLPDGTRDTTFGGGDGRVRVDVGGSDYALDLVVLDDDAIAVTGVRVGPRGGDDRAFVARVGPRGAPTTAFAGDGIRIVDFERPRQATNAIAVTPRARLVIAGFASNGTTTRTALARLMPDGRLDRRFSGDGKVLVDLSDGSETGHDLVVLGDGRIVVAGEADVGLQPRFLIARFLGSGALDTRFGLARGVTRTDVAAGADAAFAVVRDAEGRYVLAGRTANGGRQDWAIARYGIRGRPDDSFAGDGARVIRFTEAAEDATDVVTQGRRIVVVGRARRGGTMDLVVARLKSGGPLDPTFGGGDGIANVDVNDGVDAARAVTLQPNGKIVAAGETWAGKVPRFLVVRLRST